ncbi:hypothetical protein D3C74_349160 [compost metagenome]
MSETPTAPLTPTTVVQRGSIDVTGTTIAEIAETAISLADSLGGATHEVTTVVLGPLTRVYSNGDLFRSEVAFELAPIPEPVLPEEPGVDEGLEGSEPTA